MCPYCAIGQHLLCLSDEVKTGVCCCGDSDNEALESFFGLDSAPKINMRNKGKLRAGETLKDAVSTGRKRAAELLPSRVLFTMTCQWAHLKFAGGGIVPIIGCKGNKATDRHHGPNKSVLDNDEQFPEIGHNLHGICKICHNRWHSQNDKYYGDHGKDDRPEAGKLWLPMPEHGDCKDHDRVTLATDEEIETAEKLWALKPAVRELISGT